MAGVGGDRRHGGGAQWCDRGAARGSGSCRYAVRGTVRTLPFRIVLRAGQGRHEDRHPQPAASAARKTDVAAMGVNRSEEHTSELQSHLNLVCRLLLEKKKKIKMQSISCTPV